MSPASRTGGEVSTQEPTELGGDAEQPGSITSAVLKKLHPAQALDWHWGSEQCLRTEWNAQELIQNWPKPQQQPSHRKHLVKAKKGNAHS